jgi:hypothetical protein
LTIFSYPKLEDMYSDKNNKMAIMKQTAWQHNGTQPPLTYTQYVGSTSVYTDQGLVDEGWNRPVRSTPSSVLAPRELIFPCSTASCSCVYPVHLPASASSLLITWALLTSHPTFLFPSTPCVYSGQTPPTPNTFLLLHSRSFLLAPCRETKGPTHQGRGLGMEGMEMEGSLDGVTEQEETWPGTGLIWEWGESVSEGCL